MQVADKDLNLLECIGLLNINKEYPCKRPILSASGRKGPCFSEDSDSEEGFSAWPESYLPAVMLCQLVKILTVTLSPPNP